MRPVLVLCGALLACARAGEPGPPAMLVIVSIDAAAAYHALAARPPSWAQPIEPLPAPGTDLRNAASVCGLKIFTAEEIRGASRIVFTSAADDARILKCIDAEVHYPIDVRWRRDDGSAA